MIDNIRSVWKNRNDIAMGFLMVTTIYIVFVASNITKKKQGHKDDINLI